MVVVITGASAGVDRSRVKITMVQLPTLNTPQFCWGGDHGAHGDFDAQRKE